MTRACAHMRHTADTHAFPKKETKGRLCKRAIVANVPSFRFMIPSFWFLYPRSSFGGPGTSAKATLLETTLFQRTVKGARRKGRRISALFDNFQKSSRISVKNIFSTLFDHLRAAPIFRPFLEPRKVPQVCVVASRFGDRDD